MSENPFDRPCSSEAQPVAPASQSFAQLQAQTRTLVADCEQERHQHRKAWEKHKREHHDRRLEQALEREAAAGRFIPPLVQAERDAQDDRRYAHFTDFDQLLELPTHEEYLRARRAWERRHRVEDLEVNVEVQTHSPPNAAQIWAILVAIGVAIVFGASLKESLWALAFLPIALLAWVFIARLPGIYQGTFTSGRGGARGAPGNAV